MNKLAIREGKLVTLLSLKLFGGIVATAVVVEC